MFLSVYLSNKVLPNFVNHLVSLVIPPITKITIVSSDNPHQTWTQESSNENMENQQALKDCYKYSVAQHCNKDEKLTFCQKQAKLSLLSPLTGIQFKIWLTLVSYFAYMI